MRAELEDWKYGWCGIQLGIHRSEVDALIERLVMLRDDPEQHFHISSDYKASGGIGDIEIYCLPDDSPHNLFLSSRALGPGEKISTQTD